MAQFEQTMRTIRVTCGGKFKLSDELIDGVALLLPTLVTCHYYNAERCCSCRFEEGKIHREQQRPEVVRVLRGADERDSIEEERNQRAKDAGPDRQPAADRVEAALAGRVERMQGHAARHPGQVRADF
jgi:coenzyme F420-reducing hydrogenase delta subunit